MLNWLRKLWQRLFHKRLKAKNVEPIELVAGGFMKAPDYMCVGKDGFDRKEVKNGHTKKR